MVIDAIYYQCLNMVCTHTHIYNHTLSFAACYVYRMHTDGKGHVSKYVTLNFLLYFPLCLLLSAHVGSLALRFMRAINVERYLYCFSRHSSSLVWMKSNLMGGHKAIPEWWLTFTQYQQFIMQTRRIDIWLNSDMDGLQMDNWEVAFFVSTETHKRLWVTYDGTDGSDAIVMRTRVAKIAPFMLFP